MITVVHDSIEKTLAVARDRGQSIGFVPTMGALHAGHLSLIDRAASQNDLPVISIFVNPTQFNNSADLSSYPRTLERDLALIKDAFSSRPIIVWAPEVKDIYGEKIESASYNFGPIAMQMEGASRPGHFDGVGTILQHLFSKIGPDVAYFGEKDFQQLQIVRKLVELLNLDIIIEGCPIKREPSGLAMSSRNRRLSDEGLIKASQIYKTLLAVVARYGKESLEDTYAFVAQTIAGVDGMRLEYFTICYEATLQEVEDASVSEGIRAFIVVHLENVRLIDNMQL